MFGYATLANSPFAALGVSGAVYDVAVDEAGSTAAEVLSANNQFVAAQTEAASSAAVFNTLNNIFNNLITEAGSTAAVQAAQVNFAGLMAEVVSAQSAQTVIATMLASQSETVEVWVESK